jgi:ABC-type Fe3+ transport system substrate-binding protein
MTANNDKQLTRRALLRGMLATPAVLMSPTMSKQAASALHNLAATAQAPLVAAQTAAAQPGSTLAPSLQWLYNEARAEGGQLVVFAGGDAPDQNDGVKQAFEQQFPGLTMTIKTDLSKYHDARIDNQLARKRLEPDVAQLQTLQDFDRWKHEGVLLRYKPEGFDQVYKEFKDKDGYYTGFMVLAFSYLSNNTLVPPAQAPRTARDFLDPKYTGKLTITWPNDDDAVLYMFKNIIDKYGWGYMDGLMAQQPTFVRGLPSSVGAVMSGQAAATIAGISGLVGNPASPATFTIPADDFFQSWAQTAAIFKNAKHPFAAKLYLSWLLSKPFQEQSFQWSVRKDVPPPAGYKPILEYANTNPVGFHEWMKDRAAVEQFKSQIELYAGRPQGPNPAGAEGPLLLTRN